MVTFWGLNSKAPAQDSHSSEKQSTGRPPSRPDANYGSQITSQAPEPKDVQHSQPLDTMPSRRQSVDEAGINIPSSAQQPKGQLRVCVIEARNLLVDVNSGAEPYVVATYSAAEHVTKSASVRDKGIAIPSKGPGRQQSTVSMKKTCEQSQEGRDCQNPLWKDESLFDVTSYDSELEVFVYDAGNQDRFLGWAHIRPDFSTTAATEHWYPLQGRAKGERARGEIRVSTQFERVAQTHYGPEHFEVLRLVGKGTFGQVYQVRKKDTRRVYAMKVLSKRVIVQKKEIAHTIGERNILVRTSSAASFLVGLKFSFQTAADLYLVTDYMSGGELFWHLQREGRFPEARAKFYIAELIIALQHLHNNDIVYRDLKPENILLDATGHIALCDFGLSKANLNNGTTNTFCGTTEYLAPEVLLDDKGYTKMVDFWSLGVLIFEMCCGWSPFYAEDNQQMYKNIAFGKVRFPRDALSSEGRDFVKGLLNRNPKHRLGATGDAAELMAHSFFHDIDWDLLRKKQIPPPYKPTVSSDDDTSNFDPEFTQASTSIFARGGISSTPLSPGIQDKFKGFTYVDDTLEDHFRSTTRYGSSVRPQTFVPKEEGIDLYDDNDIKMSESYYTSGINSKFSGRPPGREEDDVRMSDVEEESELPDHADDDFVTGQGFEI